MGNSYQEMNDIVKALNAYQKLIEFYPDNKYIDEVIKLIETLAAAEDPDEDALLDEQVPEEDLPLDDGFERGNSGLWKRRRKNRPAFYLAKYNRFSDDIYPDIFHGISGFFYYPNT